MKIMGFYLGFISASPRCSESTESGPCFSPEFWTLVMPDSRATLPSVKRRKKMKFGPKWIYRYTKWPIKVKMVDMSKMMLTPIASGKIPYYRPAYSDCANGFHAASSTGHLVHC